MHAVDVLRAGLIAHQDHRLAGLTEPLGLAGVEHDLAGCRAGRSRQAGRDDLARRVRIDSRVQELVERCRVDARHRLVLADQALASHLDGDLQRRLGGALAAARLQHVERALLHRELDVLHVAVVALELLDDAA